MSKPLVTLLVLVAAATASAAPLRVCATIPDLANLVSQVGGAEVTVTTFAKPTEDPHFIEAKPSFLKALSEADLLVVNGLDLEIGWLPVLQKNARNAAVLAGGPGYLDASRAITPLDLPTGTVDRSMGDVHPFGNPHFLADPLNGLRVAAAIADRLAELRPADRATFEQRQQDFRARLGAKLVGETLARKYDADKLAQLAALGKLDAFLASQGDAAALGGWLADVRPYRGSRAVDDHPMWPYFAARFGLEIVGDMEPKPGIPPTTKQLEALVALMQRDGVKLILASAYYDARHAQVLAGATGARIASLANLVGARPGTDDYLAMVDYNVRQVVEVLRGR